MKTQVYDVDFFINFFELIPYNRWITGSFTEDDKHCAVGHICNNEEYNEEMRFALCKIVKAVWFSHYPLGNDFYALVIPINDGNHPKYQQSNPRDRILAALYDYKERFTEQTQETNEIKELNGQKHTAIGVN